MRRTAAKSRDFGAAARLTLAVWFGFISGCQKPAPPAPIAKVPLPTIDRSSPTGLALSALRLIQADLRAVATRDAGTSAAARQELAQLVSQAFLDKELGAGRRGASIPTAELALALVGNWSAALAYYADGIDFDHPSEQGAADQSGRVAVVLPAEHGAHFAEVRVECVSEATDVWSIRMIDFATPIKSVVRSVRPASAPSSAPSP